MKDFLHDRPSLAPLKGFTLPVAPSPGALRALHDATPAPTHPEANAPSGKCEGAEPTVEIREANGRIEQIIVTCACGERITLQCAY
jgi:hypothetical protein